MNKIIIEVDIPDDDVKTFLTYVRAFDLSRPGCHFKIACIAPGMSADTAANMLKGMGMNCTVIAKKNNLQ